jgi:hypothetical protein
MMINIGYLVKEIFVNGGSASVLGKTSRGIYLSTSSRWVFYCSWEHFRSPLTLNVIERSNDFDGVAIGMRAQFEADQLTIHGADLCLSLKNSHEWFPIKPVHSPFKNEGFIDRFDSLMSMVLYTKQRGEEVIEFPEFWVQDEGDRLDDALVQRLGLGDGLTPSGDDFVLGFLLAMNRYKRFLWINNDLERLNRRIMSAAYQKTTRLSANLIELATLGESDERLLAAVDYLQGADYDLEEIAVELSSWGHTSGVAVLVGMATAFKMKLSD